MSAPKVARTRNQAGASGGGKVNMMELAARIKGKYARIPYYSENFIHGKRREIALEDRM
jgi:hypothetical protein